MKNYSKNFWMAGALFGLLALPAATLNAQRRGASYPVPHHPEPTSPVTGNAVNGKKLYYSYGCYACHGYTGETGYRAFIGNWGHLANEQQFITFLRGRVNVAPVTPSDNMPNFSAKVLADKQAKDIYAYIRTFKDHANASNPVLTEIVNAAKRENN